MKLTSIAALTAAAIFASTLVSAAIHPARA